MDTTARYLLIYFSAGKYYYHYGKVEGSLVRDVSPNAPLWRTWDDANRFGLFLWLSGVRKYWISRPRAIVVYSSIHGT